MLPSYSRSHKEYTDFVSSQKCPLPARHLWVRQALFLCDLTIVRSHATMMFFTYSMFGRPAWAPEDIFRSMLAMVLCGITSFEVWVTKMKEEPFYAIISGFRPENVPGVGTFYDFTDRIRGRRCAVVNYRFARRLALRWSYGAQSHRAWNHQYKQAKIACIMANRKGQRKIDF